MQIGFCLLIPGELVSGHDHCCYVAMGVAEKVAVSDGEVCLICQTLANYAGEAVKEQATQDEVERLLMDICTILPDNLTEAVSTHLNVPAVLAVPGKALSPHPRRHLHHPPSDNLTGAVSTSEDSRQLGSILQSPLSPSPQTTTPSCSTTSLMPKVLLRIPIGPHLIYPLPLHHPA